jgi:Ricin-type beta-trefoil lectin domain-like
VPLNPTNPIMLPNGNNSNPMLSSAQGIYGWSVIPGWYKVTAALNGVSVTSAAQQVTTTKPLADVNLTLPVTAPPPPPPQAYTANVTSRWVVNNVVRRLTSPDSTQNDAEMHGQPVTSGWNTQEWFVEPVTGSNRVRLKNVRTGNYLTAQGTTPVEYAKVVGNNFRGDWTSQEWIVEPIAGTNEVRLKNAYNPRYLTVVDNSTYSGIQMQTLSSQNWASQRWVIQ